MGKLNVRSLKILWMKKAISTKSFWEFKKLLKRRHHAVNYKREPFKLSKFHDSECLLFFRFTASEIQTLVEKLRVPKKNRLENRATCTGIEGFCILLRRLAYPNRLVDLVKFFNRDKTTLSRIFNFMLTFVYSNHAKRLHSLKQTYLTPSVLQQLADNASECGSPYPNIIGFIDGTCRDICRPSRKQKDYYSCYTRHHCIKYQSVMLTNGIMGRLDGPFIGRRHDSAILYLSHILDEMSHFLRRKNGTNYAVSGIFKSKVY